MGGLVTQYGSDQFEMYRLSQNVHDKVRQSIIITGSGRSGTSIFGKLIGSLKTVEYFFEPPTLVSLFSMLPDLTAPQARVLFDAYVYEDLLIGALSGRSINLRLQDDSSIRHTKSEAEISRRLQASARKRELLTTESEIALKIPSFVYRLREIVDKLKLNRVLVLVREPMSTLNSLLERRWFSDAMLLTGEITWPNRFDCRIPIPHWVPHKWSGEWCHMSEADRAALYYITQTELSNAEVPGLVVLDYHHILADPCHLLEGIAEMFGLNFGTETVTLLNQVGVQKSTMHFDLNYLREEFRSRVLAAYDHTDSLCQRF